jgi:excisionase family DNA binding protein
MEEFDALDVMEVMDRFSFYATAIPGDVAWLFTRLWLPDLEAAKQRLDLEGIRGTPAAEYKRMSVLCALEALRRRGEEWHESKTPALSSEEHSEEDMEPMTRAEAAEALGITKQRVGQLLQRGALRGSKVGKEWLLDRASVKARAKDVTQ